MNLLQLAKILKQPKDNVYTSLCFMLLPEIEDIADISEYAALDIEELHTTVLYCGDADQYTDRGLTHEDIVQAVQKMFLDKQPHGIFADVAKVHAFDATKEGDYPVVLRLNSTSVRKFRRDLMEALEDLKIEDDSQHSFNPHLTLGYADEKPVDLPSLPPTRIRFRGLRIAMRGVDIDIEFDASDTKDVYGGMPGLRKRRKRQREIIQRPQVARRARMMLSREQKDIRYVRTPEGAAHFGQPIGSIIVAGRITLPNITIPSKNSKPYKGFKRVASASGNQYDIGKSDDGKYAVYKVGDDGVSSWDDEVLWNANSEEDALIALNELIENGKEELSTSLDANSVRPKNDEDIRGERANERAGGGRSTRVMTPAERKKWGVPPAWTEVRWNNERDEAADDENYDGLIATGYDAAGRKQMLFTHRHRSASSNRIQNAARQLEENYTKISRRVRKDAASGNEEARALMVAMIMASRIGGEGDGKAKVKAYGITTLEARHVTVKDGVVQLDFIGKKGERNRPRTRDKAMVEIFKSAIEGKESKDRVFDTTEGRMNAYFNDVQKSVGMKDAPASVHTFRHRIANAEAYKLLKKFEEDGEFTFKRQVKNRQTGRMNTKTEKVPFPPESKVAFGKLRKAVGQHVADILQNQVTQALGSYIAPEMFDLYSEEEEWQPVDPRRWQPGQPLVTTIAAAAKKKVS